MQIIKNLLWVDCTAGAVAGLLVVLFSGWLSGLYAIPENLLLLIGATNLVYACYSFSLARRAKREKVLINILISANALWAFVCMGIATQYLGTMTLLGSVHLAGEAIFVGGLAALELRWRNQLLTAT
ncbi:hypothetical protein [Pseudomonas leptonychotis]|uniref:Transporter n=1 Tax=Pseudomonas leptonychotis TaxID=2448482 RepID=A0A4T2A5V8_9PSED|nr:hypothetical protein [Pseudomonas leptonychotis]TIH10466.1 hypothetical protein D8779_07260 [Pseudomonas leptonychotis]